MLKETLWVRLPWLMKLAPALLEMIERSPEAVEIESKVSVLPAPAVRLAPELKTTTFPARTSFWSQLRIADEFSVRFTPAKVVPPLKVTVFPEAIMTSPG